MKVVACAILRDSQGRILLCRRAPGQSHAGHWEFPGGKQEAGETLPECLMREMQEELALTIAVGPEIMESDYQYKTGSIRLIALEAYCSGAQPVPSVHDEIAWVEPAHLSRYALTAADVPIALKLSTP